MLSPLKYLKQELNFSLSEWGELSDQDKKDLRQWAQEEQEILEKEAEK